MARIDIDAIVRSNEEVELLCGKCNLVCDQNGSHGWGASRSIWRAE